MKGKDKTPYLSHR